MIKEGFVVFFRIFLPRGPLRATKDFFSYMDDQVSCISYWELRKATEFLRDGRFFFMDLGGNGWASRIGTVFVP